MGVGEADNADLSFAAQPGAVTVATGVDERWTIQLGAESIAPRPAFGTTTGYDITSGGPATLQYHTSISRAFALIGQLVVWLLLVLGISRFDTSSIARWRRRRVTAAPEAPLLSIDAPIVPPTDTSVLVSLNDDSVPWQPDTPKAVTSHAVTSQTVRCRSAGRCRMTPVAGSCAILVLGSIVGVVMLQRSRPCRVARPSYHVS